MQMHHHMRVVNGILNNGSYVEAEKNNNKKVMQTILTDRRSFTLLYDSSILFAVE